MALPDVAYWVALNHVPGLGGESYRALLQAFGEPREIFATHHSALCKVVKSPIARAINDGPDEQSLQPTVEWLALPGNDIITLADSVYPQGLLQITDPPPLLYVKGRSELLNHPAIAIVGSRSATPQGLQNAQSFAAALGDAGLCIVSGMASGIDSAAHRGGVTSAASSVGVMGTGLDIIYPSSNWSLAQDMARQGALLSEFALGTPAKAQNFPRRNRIISALGLGCLVVEASLNSGSLITARFAAEQGREVFAMPGSIHSPLSKGCHFLIKQGAKLVESAQDVLDELGWGSGVTPPQAQPQSIDREAQTLLDQLGFDPVDIDTLAARSGLTVGALSAMLLTLELEGRVASLPGNLFQRMR
ncbi:MAG: DNA-processing protein DprA [Burkholderiales bacterium]